MTPPARMETKRLVLRRPSMKDARAIFEEYAQDAEVTRYLRWPPQPGVDGVRAFLKHAAAMWREKSEFNWAITRRHDDRTIGMIGARITMHGAELGYVLGRAHWGQGMMSEAAGAVTTWALDEPTIHRVWAVCDVDNPASARVMEKLGMEREGKLRAWSPHPNVSDVPRDCWCYARIKRPAR